MTENERKEKTQQNISSFINSIYAQGYKIIGQPTKELENKERDHLIDILCVFIQNLNNQKIW